MKKIFLLFPLLTFLFLTAGCRTPLSEMPPHTGEWTASDIRKDLGGNDPIEPFNRVMFNINEVLLHCLVQPVGYIYGSILPWEVIKRIDMAADNLGFPGRSISALLQGKYAASGKEALRFLTNTTIGIGGLFDPAEYYFDLPRLNDDFGQAFARLGMDPGCILFLPFLSSTNVRDHVGTIFDNAFDIKTYIPYAGYIINLNKAVSGYQSFNALTESCADSYEEMLALSIPFRHALIEDMDEKLRNAPRPDFEKLLALSKKAYPAEKITLRGKVSFLADSYGRQAPAVDTVKSALFKMQKNNESIWIKTSFWNRDFVKLASSRSVPLLGEDAPELPYQFWPWKEKKNAPLIVLLPGAGGHHKGSTPRALAELLYFAGYHVALISNTLNPAFSNAAGLLYPGSVPEDAAMVRKAVDGIWKDVQDYLEQKPEKLILCGYSMGALQLLHIAAMEEKSPRLPIERYIAINPPVDLLVAMKTMDDYFAVSRNWSREKFLEILGFAGAYAGATLQAKIPYLDPSRKKDHYRFTLPLSPDVSCWIAGYFMRNGLRELLFNAQKMAPEGAKPLRTPYRVLRRTPLYREIDTYSFTRYAKEILLPFHRKKNPSLTLESFSYASSLYAVRSTLQNNDKIRILHNLNDPLLSRKDILFLDRACGKKIHWFDCGGHLGNMYFLPWQSALFTFLQKK